MSKRAHVESITSISRLRGKVIETSEAINLEVDACLGQVKRVLSSVQGPQLDHWKQQVRKREQKIATALSDLERAKIARPDADPRTFVDQQRAVKRARQAVDEAKEKIRRLKYWGRELEREAMKFRGELQPISSYGALWLPQAARWLEQLIRHLDGYVATAPAMPEFTAEDTSTEASMGRTGTSESTDPDKMEDPST